ncbi:MAG: hypothetical protein R2825_03775 [Saprospiraceae bacterium]
MDQICTRLRQTGLDQLADDVGYFSESSSSIKKSLSLAFDISGNSPIFTLCALVMILECAACRNISVNFVTGIFSELIKSFKTLPAPTLGN